jgi:hypothetical protein
VCVLAGPDIDTDAYAHHMIARAILADPRDLAVHWVWLPLFHYAQVPLVALGGTLNDVRWINVVLSAALPAFLFRYVRARARPGVMTADATALVAAVLAAACPIAMQMGTTAQSEPLFALLALGIAIAFQERRYGVTGALLGAAVLTRYEGWAIFATVGALAVAEPLLARLRAKAGAAPEESGRRWIAVAVPAALILAWAALRRPVDGRWFGFLGETHEFASAATGGGRARDAIGFARDALYYPAHVAWRVLGPALPLAAFGVLRTWRDQGGRFVLVLAACLGFVSLTWVNRSSLGLDRHFVAVVPLYATFAAQGIAAIGDRAQGRLESLASERSARRAALAIVSMLTIGTVGALAVMLSVWMTFWRASIDHGWPERVALGAYLRSIPPEPTIFCDDATLEILSGLDRRRFDRHWIDDPHTWDLVAATAQAAGGTYVATWQRKLIGHENAGQVVFHAADDPAGESSGVTVMRVVPDANRAAR